MYGLGSRGEKHNRVYSKLLYQQYVGIFGGKEMTEYLRLHILQNCSLYLRMSDPIQA